jgi:predicted Zn-dependent protease
VHPRKNVTRVALNDVKHCTDIALPITAEEQNIQLLQVASSIKVHIKQCKIAVTRQINIRGGLESYLSAVPSGLSQYIQSVQNIECSDMHKNRSSISGELTTDGYCKGVNYNFNGFTYTGVVVQLALTITLTDYCTDAMADDDMILLRSCKSCSYKEGSCLDHELGHTFWSVDPEMFCMTFKYDVLYQGLKGLKDSFVF